MSFRILPRELGAAERSAAAATEAARVSLRSVTDNPVFLPPTDDHPRGRVLSTGGYHNSAAPQALNGLAISSADLARLAERHIEHVWTAVGKGHGQSVDELLGLLLMVAAGYCEEAAAAAQPTLLVRSGPGQNDVGAPSFLAWRRCRDAGDSLDACLGILLVVSAQILHAEGRGAPPALAARYAQVMRLYPPPGDSYPEHMSALVGELRAEIHTDSRSQRLFRSRAIDCDGAGR